VLCLGRRSGEGAVIIDRETGRQIGRVVYLYLDRHTKLGFQFDDRYLIVRDELLGTPSNPQPPTNGKAGAS
jgi:hypothetical protein